MNEWLSNPSSYEPFLTSGQDYETEANLFLQDGHFASELGNSIPLAASSGLCLPIVVFTPVLNFPLRPTCPQDMRLVASLTRRMSPYKIWRLVSGL